ncbi:low affinity iron permease family protein [Phenylobacterium conjunctum]|uniref:Low affinity iron permease family protein n=1 Tax=Phenylobacterium conjunctum TaxID=1298959 RepID=A0ABW3SYD7_9CAUL
MSRISKTFTRFSTAVARWTGRPMVFITCCALVILWAVSGPLFGFSDTWQLVINTSTTIITFLMVFLIQNTQNRDSNALHAKLDELIRISEAHNSFIGIENLSDEELEEILAECDKNSTRLREEARKEVSARQSKPAAHKPARRRTATKRSAKAA